MGNVAKRAFGYLGKRYYGDSHGLAPPPALGFKKRDASIPSGWSYFGCVDESWNERLLQGFAYSSASLTPLQCLTLCSSGGYTYAGLEYGDECYCGNEFIGTGGTVGSDSTCNTPCAGESSEMCGAAWELSLYKYAAPAIGSCNNDNTTTTPMDPTNTATSTVSTTSTSTTITSTPTATSTMPVYVDITDSSEWYHLGCAIDSYDPRVFSYGGDYKNELTIDSCLIDCEDAGYTYAGLEYGIQCYCGNSIDSSVTYDVESACGTPCGGNSTEMCGGNYRLDVYQFISAAETECNATTTAIPSSNNNIVLPTGTGTTGKPTTTTITTSTGTTTATGAVVTGSSGIPSSSATHTVYAHHMVGNTYPYAQSDWASDIAAAQAAGIDGFALNMGSDWWQPARVNDAYNAASAVGFKVFLSLDMTSLSCGSAGDAATLVALVATHAGSSAQAMHNGKPMVSTFSGSDCTFGVGSAAVGWESLFKSALAAVGHNIFFVPSIFSDISTFAGDSWMDGELNWNSGWPTGASDLDTSSDVAYMKALGSKEYMPAISPAFFTHFPPSGWNKNWIYRGDDWLYITRWEQVIAMRDKVVMTEILTWNDYGESSYIGPITGALPAGSNAWVDGFEHTPWLALTNYYATAFKTGSYPSITKDSITMWSRPHPKGATATSDSMSKPTGWQDTDDNLYAVVMATSAATVTLKSGSTSQTFSVSAGVNKLKMPSAVGSMSGTIVRGGSTIASYNAGSAFQYTNSPSTYNFNYFVGGSS